MRDKLLIVVIWCMAPLSAMLFLAADYRHFSTETLRQEQYCNELRVHLDQYALRFGQQIGTIQRIQDPNQREQWRSRSDHVSRLAGTFDVPAKLIVSPTAHVVGVVVMLTVGGAPTVIVWVVVPIRPAVSVTRRRTVTVPAAV